jgi:serine/threonine protein kinase
MTFIDAPTLSEFMRLKVVREFEPLERLAVFEAVMGGICMALQSCLKQRRNHLDLSPDNVLVSHTYGRVNKIWLIDFGVNYLLREGLGVSRARAEVFFAPELKRRSALGDDMSDVYSLGMIMMELLLGEELKISTYMDRLDKVWESHPEFGEVIEDMIDPQQEDSSGVQPINRLMLFDREGNVFETIGYKVEKLVRLRRDRSTIPHPLLQLTDVLQNFVPIATLIQLSSDWVRSKNRPARRLYLWLWGAHLVELVTIFAFVVFMLFPFWPLYNWRACSSIGGCLLNIQSPPLPRFNGALAGRVNGFLPGRLVALSFSLVLTAYYANIFSTIQTKHLSSSDRRWLPVLVDIIMRTCPFFGAVPVLWAMIVDPKAWPFCSALGLAMVGLNNWWSYRFVRYALDKMKTQLRCPFTKSVEDQINQFSSWWWMIALYSASLVVVGSLLVLGAAKDEWLYAVFVVVFVNFLKMQMDNCGESAPGVRGLLRRLATGLARARAAAASTTPSNAAVLTVANGR